MDMHMDIFSIMAAQGFYCDLKRQYCTCTVLKGQLWLRHVKGHSGHKWNDRADALADEGRCGRLRAAPARVVD